MRRAMKVLAVLLLILVLLPGVAVGVQHLRHSVSAPLPPPSGLRVASHNVHYIILPKETGAWSVADWHSRKTALNAAFQAMDADLVAFQEMESFQRGSDGSVNLARDWLAKNNPGYAVAATGDWRSFPTTQPIFYRKARLTLRDQGWFFFSETPDVIYSPTFNGSYPAFASWAVFQDLHGGPDFAVMNMHFEFKSISNRRKSAALVAARSQALFPPDMPVLLLGDLNARQGAATLRILEEAGFAFPSFPGATYHLNRGLNLFAAIDHAGLRGPVRTVSGPQVVQRSYDGVWPSDHHPVVADLEWTN